MRETQATHNRIPGRADNTDARASEFVMRRYDRSDWTDSDQAELNAWLEESLANRAAYWRLKAAWTRADRLDALRSAWPVEDTHRSSLRSNIGLKFASAFALAAVVAGAVWFANQPAMQTISTKIGERRSFQLADGSHVELTTNTTIRVAANGARRKSGSTRAKRSSASFTMRNAPSKFGRPVFALSILERSLRFGAMPISLQSRFSKEA